MKTLIIYYKIIKFSNKKMKKMINKLNVKFLKLNNYLKLNNQFNQKQIIKYYNAKIKMMKFNN